MLTIIFFSSSLHINLDKKSPWVGFWKQNYDTEISGQGWAGAGGL
jgi:hypothetical protein